MNALTKTISAIKDRQMENVTSAKKLVTVCSYCKKIRSREGFWRCVDSMAEYSGAELTHGICPECAEKLYPEIYKKCIHG